MDLSYCLGKSVKNAIDSEMSSLTYIKVDDLANQLSSPNGQRDTHGKNGCRRSI